jgi:hypothetical protein
MSGIGPVTGAPSLLGHNCDQGCGADPLAAALPDARRASQMRSAIEAGRYPVDAQRLAERLLELGVIGPDLGSGASLPGDRLA